MLRWLAMLLGPIFAKEMVEMARRKRYYFNRILYGLTLLFVLFLIWDANEWRLRYAGPGVIRVQAEIAEEFYYGVVGVQYAAVVLFAPLFLAGVIASEREEKTLDLLLTTQLRDREIILGKLFSRIAVLILIMFSGLPVLSLVMLMGGISPVGLALVTVATLLMILFCSAHAIYFSTITKSPMAALIRTYWWLAVWLLGVPWAVGMVVVAILDWVPWPLRRGFTGQAACIGMFVNPIGPFIVAVVPEAYDEAAKFLGEWFFPFTLIVPVVWSVLLIWLAVYRLRGDVTPFVRRFGRFTGLSWLRGKLRSLHGRFHAALRRETAGWADDPLLRPVGNSLVGDVDNPFQQRARRVRVYDREQVIGRIQWAGWAAAFFSLFLVAVNDPDSLAEDEVSATFQGLTWLGIALVTAILAGTSLVGDRRRGFLEQVLVTPLSGQEVIDGTLLAVWEHMRRIALLPVVLGVLFCFTGASTVLGTIFSFITAALTLAVIALCGVGCSLPAKTMPGALAATVVCPLIVNLVPPMFSNEFRYDHGPLLWGCTTLLFLGSVLWVGRRVNTASVCAWMLAMQMALLCLATYWTIFDNAKHMPAAAMNPAYWTLISLQGGSRFFWREYFSLWGIFMLLAHWLAVAGSFLWARWWLIRNFDRLAGRARRPQQKREKSVSPLAEGRDRHQELAFRET